MFDALRLEIDPPTDAERRALHPLVRLYLEGIERRNDELASRVAALETEKYGGGFDAGKIQVTDFVSLSLHRDEKAKRDDIIAAQRKLIGDQRKQIELLTAERDSNERLASARGKLVLAQQDRLHDGGERIRELEVELRDARADLHVQAGLTKAVADAARRAGLRIVID